jgi:hypothetical protein
MLVKQLVQYHKAPAGIVNYELAKNEHPANVSDTKEVDSTPLHSDMDTTAAVDHLCQVILTGKYPPRWGA